MDCFTCMLFLWKAGKLDHINGSWNQEIIRADNSGQGMKIKLQRLTYDSGQQLWVVFNHASKQICSLWNTDTFPTHLYP